MKKFTAIILLLAMFVIAGCQKEETSVKETKPDIVENNGKKTPSEEISEEESGSLPKDEPAPVPEEEPADEEIVVVKDYIPDVIVDLKYATEDNFTGKVIYEDAVARLRYGSVKKLMKVQEELRENGMCLVIWDAYRPVAAQFKLWEICPDPAFVANPNKGFSGHSRGNTMDITVADKSGNLIPMPSDFDEFNAKADRSYSDVSKEAGENSQMLEDIMEKNGFSGYSGEWWHYSDVKEYPVVK